MQYQKGLIQKYLKTLKQTKWYHQRFDACPQHLGMVSFPHFFKEKRKPKGTEFMDLLVIYTGGTADWHINMKDIRRIANIFILKSKKEANISQRLIEKWEEDEKKYYQKCQEIDQLNLSPLSDNELLRLYQDLLDVYLKWFSMTSIIDGFALGSDEFINNAINKHLEKLGIEKGKGKIFAKLTAPTAISFVNEGEISLLKVALAIQSKPALFKFFQNNNPSQILKEIKKYPEISKQLQKHQKKYFWLRNNYVTNHIITIEEFILELKKIFSGKVGIKKRLQDLINQPQSNKKKKKSLIAKLKIPLYLQNLIEISEDFTTWQDQRKKSTFFATHYFSLILTEITKREPYTLEELKFFMPDEIMALLQHCGRYPSRKEAQERVKYSLFYYRDKYYEVFTGKGAKDILGEIFGEEKKRGVNDFRGMTACPGQITGRVRIIKSAKEVNKIQKGEILVAVMTRPDYIMGIKKASAIVTNEGGLTCHAAIVSRELNIPCIIGTRIATEVLKDGDLVYVDANHAVVKIIKSGRGNS